MGSPTRRKWSKDELTLLRDTTVAAPEIAEKINATIRQVRYKRHRLNIKYLPLCKFCNEQVTDHPGNDFGVYCIEHREIGRSYAAYKSGADIRSLDFDVPISVFVEWWGNTNCTYCGERILTIGIDRVDNSRGYDEANIVPCCKLCNKLKGNLSIEEWLEHLYKIINFMETK